MPTLQNCCFPDALKKKSFGGESVREAYPMGESSGLFQVVLAAVGLGLTMLFWYVLPHLRLKTVLTTAVVVAVSAAGLTGVYWLLAGSRADQLPGAVLVAGAVVGLAVLVARSPSSAGPSPP